MIYNLNEFAKEVHENAVAHGFWDDDATDERQIALIHSEWSEALQADRSGCTPREVCMELIDGVLRVLDYCAEKGVQVADCKWESTMGFFNLVVHLHNITSMLIHIPRMVSPKRQTYIVSAVFAFVRSYDLDPYELMKQKHEFNLTRPHKHGKLY